MVDRRTQRGKETFSAEIEFTRLYRHRNNAPRAWPQLFTLCILTRLMQRLSGAVVRVGTFQGCNIFFLVLVVLLRGCIAISHRNAAQLRTLPPMPASITRRTDTIVITMSACEFHPLTPVANTQRKIIPRFRTFNFIIVYFIVASRHCFLAWFGFALVWPCFALILLWFCFAFALCLFPRLATAGFVRVSKFSIVNSIFFERSDETDIIPNYTGRDRVAETSNSRD